MVAASVAPKSQSVRPEPYRGTERSLTRAEYDRFLPLVRRTAMRLARRVPSTVNAADLVNYGWIGFLEAYRRVNSFKSADEFEAFALYRVRGAMLDHLRSLAPATRGARQTSRKVAQAAARATRTLGRAPAEEEIAAELGVSVERYRTMLSELARAGMNRLELVSMDSIEGKDAPQVDAQVEQGALRGQLAQAIGQLPERLQQVLALYYQEDISLRDVGTVLGVSESRACQLHTEAVLRLRAAIGHE
jgi:RNA polymerase sigma factor for flagellar operon FliA